MDYTLLGKLDSERMIGHGTPIKDITFLSIPEKEFLIFATYFSWNLDFFFPLNFEWMLTFTIVTGLFPSFKCIEFELYTPTVHN